MEGSGNLKRIKFLTVLIFSLSILLSSNGAIYAATADINSENLNQQLDKKLRKIGYPDELISIIHLEQKQDIVASNPVEFAGYEKQAFYYDENGKLQKIDSSVSPMSNIDKADLYFVISKTYLGTFGGRKTFRIYLDWKWNIKTFYNWEDKIALSYNDVFQTRVSTNGNYYCQHYTGAFGGTVYPADNCGGAPADISFGGASWYVDKHSGADEGYVAMDIETKATNNPPITGIILGKYVHKTGFDGGIGLTIKYVEITVTNSGGYDELATQHSFYY